jgi:tetratricopeptide (TPR) repeat protein
MKQKRDTQLPCYLNVALCKLKMEDWPAASSAASAALAMDENNSKALFRRALANVGRGWLDKANTDLRRAARLQPQSKPIRKKHMEVLGMIRARKESEKAKAAASDEPKKAALKFTGSLYKDKDDGPEERLQRLCIEGEELKIKGRHEEAIQVYKRAMMTMLKLPPAAVGEGVRLQIHESTGECCFELKYYSRAEAEFDKVAELASEAGDEMMAAEMGERAKAAWVLHEEQEREKKEAEAQAVANGEAEPAPELPKGAVSWP